MTVHGIRSLKTTSTIRAFRHLESAGYLFEGGLPVGAVEQVMSGGTGRVRLLSGFAMTTAFVSDLVSTQGRLQTEVGAET